MRHFIAGLAFLVSCSQVIHNSSVININGEEYVSSTSEVSGIEAKNSIQTIQNPAVLKTLVSQLAMRSFNSGDGDFGFLEIGSFIPKQASTMDLTGGEKLLKRCFEKKIESSLGISKLCSMHTA